MFKKIVGSLVTIVMLFSLFSVYQAPVYADCSSNSVSYTWIASTNTLSITGSGRMDDYECNPLTDSDNAPWSSYRSQIEHINVAEGITYIGESAFCYLYNLTSVSLPSSLTEIGAGAFKYSTQITTISIPSSVKIIGDNAFESCYSLTDITLGDNVTYIGESAFENSGLLSLTIGKYCQYIGSSALPYDVTVYGYNQSIPYWYCDYEGIYFEPIDDTDEKSIFINGFQLSMPLDKMRIIYSANVKPADIDSLGLIISSSQNISDLTYDTTCSSTTQYTAQPTATSPDLDSCSLFESPSTYSVDINLSSFSDYNSTFYTRAYMLLKDGTTVYSRVQSSSVTDVALNIYYGGKVHSTEFQNSLYNLISASSSYEQSKISSDRTYLNEEDYDADIDTVEINGFQISSAVNGFRTIYSIDKNADVTESGLIYGLSQYVTSSQMTVGSTNSYVHSFASTDNGLESESLSYSISGNSYAMTMKFAVGNAKEFNTGMRVRAYAKLSDGTYKYSDVYEYTITSIAKKLYETGIVKDQTFYNFLYNSIISVADSSYEAIPFSWDDTYYSTY